MGTANKPFLLLGFLMLMSLGLAAQQANTGRFSRSGKPAGLQGLSTASQAESRTQFTQAQAPVATENRGAGLYLQPNKYFSLQEKPEYRGRDFLMQFLGGFAGMAVGSLVGLVFGGIVGGTLDGSRQTNPWFNWGGEDIGFGWGALAGSVLGGGVGVWMGGNTDQMRGNILITLLGAMVGGAVGYYFALSTDGALFLFPVVFTLGGGMLGFSLSRKSWTPPSTDGRSPEPATSDVRMEFLAPPSPVHGKPKLRGFRQRFGMGLFKLRF